LILADVPGCKSLLRSWADRAMIGCVERAQETFPLSGFRIAHLFPAEGDSAIAELWHDKEVWADVRLVGVRLDTRGEDRITSATAVVRLYPRSADFRPPWWEWNLEDVLGQLDSARQWLLDNERGRIPVDDRDRLTAAGQALSTASAATIDQMLASVPPATHPEPPDAGRGELEVVLVAVGPRPIELIRQIRIITGLGLMDARALLSACPSVVIIGLDRPEAARIRHALEAVGATIDVRSPRQPS
jgi:large subunit ribosomal protein L7/L12